MLIRTTLETAIRAFLRTKKSLRRKTYLFYDYHLENFVTWCIAANPQIKYLEEVKARAIDEFIGYLKRCGKSENTVTGAVKTIKIFLRWCSLDEEFEREVSQRELTKIKAPVVHEESIASFSDEEIESLLRTIEQERDPVMVARNKALVLLLLDTGIRASEVAVDSRRKDEPTGLTLQCLLTSDQHDPRISILGKGGKPREVPVGFKTAKALRIYINRYRQPTNRHQFVFLSRGTNPLTVNGLEHVLAGIGKRAGLDAYPHKFRHTFAVKYLLKHRDIYGLSRLLGHGSVKVTERYLRTLDLRVVRSRGSIVDDL